MYFWATVSDLWPGVCYVIDSVRLVISSVQFNSVITVSTVLPVTSFISGSVIPDSAQMVAAVLRKVCPVYSSGFSSPSLFAIRIPVFAVVLWPFF